MKAATEIFLAVSREYLLGTHAQTWPFPRADLLARAYSSAPPRPRGRRARARQAQPRHREPQRAEPA